MELDVWVPEHKIALEYQGKGMVFCFLQTGEHHYHDNYPSTPFSDALSTFEMRDSTKHAQCLTLGINLIYVPYWWDSDISSLSDIIYE